MDASALLISESTQEAISAIIRKTLIAGYGRILSVSVDDPNSVVVEGCACQGSTTFMAEAKLLNLTAGKVQVSFVPEVGDKVLVFGLQSYSDEMFDSKVVIADNAQNGVQHYTLLGCVAIPMNQKDDKHALNIGAADSSITINDGDDPVVRWSELNEALQKLIYQLNTHIHAVNISSETTTSITVTIPPTPVPATTPFSIDIADAKSDVLSVPAKETT